MKVKCIKACTKIFTKGEVYRTGSNFIVHDKTGTIAYQYPFAPKTIDELNKMFTSKFELVESEENETEVPSDKVNHPSHYGGDNNPYEVIKVIEAWELGFNLGNTLKYIGRCGKKDDVVQELEKARWYLDREIKKLQGEEQ